MTINNCLISLFSGLFFVTARAFGLKPVYPSVQYSLYHSWLHLSSRSLSLFLFSTPDIIAVTLHRRHCGRPASLTRLVTNLTKTTNHSCSEFKTTKLSRDLLSQCLTQAFPQASILPTNGKATTTNMLEQLAVRPIYLRLITQA